MSVEPGPHDLNLKRLVIGPQGKGTLLKVEPAFYEKLGEQFGDFSSHVLIQQFEFEEAWSTWEMHPKGDEFVYLLDGNTDMLLFENGKEERVNISRPGEYVVVPRGVWHTALPKEKTRLLFVTPGEGTQNADQPPGR